MKFFFSKTDNLYKIFKTIEKIPASRKVEIFIDPEHTLFENEWWGKQINETLSKKHIEATFVTKSKKNKEYYETVGLKVDFQGEQIVKKIFSIVSAFLFDIKKFHLYAYETKRYMFLLLSFLELGLVVAIVWFVASLIIPNATIKINPAEEREPIIYNFRYYPNNDTTNIEEKRYLNVPYYTGSLDYEYELSISTLNIKHITSPSKGFVKVFNTKEQGYSLIAGTRFITHEGVVFKALENFYLATGSVDEPSETIVQVQADEFDEREQIIGIRGNIIKGTELFIRNLTESRETKEIRAESIDNFQGGNTESLGSITQEDIDLLS
ncbi:MAG: hypothetical protein K6E76_03185 [Patescibacteria group bacterium]|nr:hypothetical protein [Patescibacteria group bacterium]